MTDNFSDYWIVNDQKITSESEMRRLVLAGHTATVVTVAQQQAAHARKQLHEKSFRQSQERYAKIQQEEAFRNSPEGRRAEALRHAQQHPGGIVSTAPHPHIAELESFMPDSTSALK
jgi:sRNA-binding protein